MNAADLFPVITAYHWWQAMKRAQSEKNNVSAQIDAAILRHRLTAFGGVLSRRDVARRESTRVKRRD